MVVHFLWAIAKNLEELGEGRVFPDLLRMNVLPLFIQHLGTNHGRMAAVDLSAGAKALAGFAAAEDFGTKKASIVGSEETVAALLTIDEVFVAEQAADPDNRRVRAVWCPRACSCV